MGQILSMMGLYNWDPTIFDNMVIPETLDRDTLINNILMESVELEVLYPDPATMKFAIGAWSQKRLHAWQKISNVLYVEDYNPFANISPCLDSVAIWPTSCCHYVTVPTSQHATGHKKTRP